MKIYYWIKFDKDYKPEKYIVENWVEFLSLLSNRALERGPIEWMIRDYYQ